MQLPKKVFVKRALNKFYRLDKSLSNNYKSLEDQYRMNDKRGAHAR